ncbi:molybdopterin-dependent oxidoreductase [Providencia rettgeri]|uniref:molybdopterin-dependent oxidoreductase n=1 Tax=Providencia TaxID=586 RepID=UPI002271CFA6|nr:MULTISPECIES: molybdopterin-dependent oxidoreductase [Providencia]MCX9123384.1 molybdopterin-dependent oxidoreductase [Providencia rettgeri]MCX9127395.1 molybdopterin-dependent oxidoreductase [Providencia rettgeri]HEM6843749.1 molybdopterin-dependent oxidoreductase [Providencia rettgeri]
MSERQKIALSRRSFIAWTSAASVMATLPLSKQLYAATPEEEKAVEQATDAVTQGKWKPVACWHNCGGRCVNKALVVDGVVVRQKTDDVVADSPDFPQQRGCLRGRSQRKQVFGADRLKYPMKRKGWAPGGGDKSLRGRDQWVRISWDEALDIVASESKRIKEKYGNESIWITGGNGVDIQNVYAKAGGFVGDWGTTSWGAWFETPAHLGLLEGFYTFGTNDRFDMRNSQLIVMWGANPAWSSPGSPTYNYYQAKKAGARFISIDPSYTTTAELMDADWYPINPGTDHALALGIMSALLEMDSPDNPLIDWDFLRRCTVGFDENNMPAGADPKGNFKDYLLGTYTGEPKTPEWASNICGLSASDIRNLACEIGGTNRVALLTGWAPARIHNGEGWVQAFSTLGFMTGHMGRPGRMTGVSCHFAAGNNGTRLVMAGASGLPSIPNPVSLKINHNELNRALLEKRFRQRGVGDVDANIQMIIHPFNATLQTRANISQSVEAYRKDVELIVTAAYVPHTCAKYSDIVLPVTTEWEREGTILNPSNREVIIAAVNVTPPLYEARSDQWIAKEIGKRLGIDVDEVFPVSEKQQFFNKLNGATIIGEDGKTTEPLITITQADIDEWQVTGKPQQGRITLNEFLTVGKYQVKRTSGDNYGYIAYEDFIRDPQTNPRPTPSGKFEIYCQTLVEKADECGWTKLPPIPEYIPSASGYEASFSDFSKKEKGDYPFQIYNPHYLRRSHSTLDNVPWLREQWPSPIYINASDAKRLGIKHGETVLITSPQGKIVRPALVTQTMKPGVVALPHGSWTNVDEKTGIDMAGADNTLTIQVPTGLGTSGWNTMLCNIEKWHGDQLVPDAAIPQRIIF